MDIDVIHMIKAWEQGWDIYVRGLYCSSCFGAVDMQNPVTIFQTIETLCGWCSLGLCHVLTEPLTYIIMQLLSYLVI